MLSLLRAWVQSLVREKKKKMRIPRASNLYKVTNQLVARVADMFQSKVHGHPSIHLFVFIEQIPDLGDGSGWRDGRGGEKTCKTNQRSPE